MIKTRVGFIYKYIPEIKSVLILGKDAKGFKLFLAKVDDAIYSKTIVLYVLDEKDFVIFLDSLENVLEGKYSFLSVKNREEIVYKGTDFCLNEYETLLVEKQMLKRELLKYDIDTLYLSDIVSVKEKEIREEVKALNFDKMFEVLSVEYVESFCRRVGKDDMYVLSKIISLPYEVDVYVEKLLQLGREVVFYDSGYAPAEELKPDWNYLALEKVDDIKVRIIADFKQNYKVEEHVKKLVYRYIDELFRNSLKVTEIKESLALNNYRIKEQWDFVNIELVPLMYTKINNDGCFLFIDDKGYVEQCKTDIYKSFVGHVENYVREFNEICEHCNVSISNVNNIRQNCNKELAVTLTRHARNTMKCWISVLEDEINKVSDNYDCDDLF